MLNKVRYRISIFLAFSYGRAEERMLDEMECHSQRTKHSAGPKTLPCGTPCLISRESDL